MTPKRKPSPELPPEHPQRRPTRKRPKPELRVDVEAMAAEAIRRDALDNPATGEFPMFSQYWIGTYTKPLRVADPPFWPVFEKWFWRCCAVYALAVVGLLLFAVADSLFGLVDP